MTPRVDISKLNDEQRAAVECIEGPLVIYAGAGSGKTRTVVHRIAHMIDQGIPASSIMAVTFTNKAAREMRERVEHLIGPYARSLVVSTFHSACARFLRIYAKEAGYSEAFSIFDDDDQRSLLKDCVKELNVPEKFLSVNQIKSRLDRVKNNGETPSEFSARIKREQATFDVSAAARFRRFGEEEHDEIIAKVYELYQKRLKAQNAMDFNDLLLEMVRLLEGNEKVRGQLQSRFRYFMVDEFQDTNPIQFRLVAALCSHTHNLCIVGDDDQSIYSWRGAEPAFILEFDKHYPAAKVVKLEQNYRSTDTIVRVATEIISNNLKRAPKKLWTTEAEGERVVVRTAADPYEEAQYVAGQVIKQVEAGARYSEFAVLYRTNAQSRAIEDELRRRMLPYVIYGSVRFYERAEIKTLLAYLRLLVNPDDDAAFVKVINTPRRGFGDKALATLKELAGKNGLSLARAADRIANNELSHDISRGVTALKAISTTFVRAYSELQLTGKPSMVLANMVAAIGYEEFVRASYPEDAEERWLNVLELKNALQDFEDRFERGEIESSTESPNVLASFLEQAQLTIEPTVHNVRAGETDAVSLMTIHSSKGLEFERVFLSGLEEGTLPHQNSLESEAAVEEERRLMYVAVTRARKRLIITHIRRNRFRPDFPAEASRFLTEMPEEYVDHVRPDTASSYGSRGYSQSYGGGAGSARKPAGSWGGSSSGGAGGSSGSGASGGSKSGVTKENLSSFVRSGDSNPGRFAFGTVGKATEDAADVANPPFTHGQKVSHRIFGEGTVVGSEKSLDGWRLEIRFPMVGLKKLMHTYVTAVGEPRISKEDVFD